MANSITVIWTDSAEDAQVTITGPGDFTVGGAAITFPYTVNSTTKFETSVDGTYVVSVTVAGVEAMGNPDASESVRLENSGVVVRPDLDNNARAGLSTTYAPQGDGTRPLRAVAIGTSIYAGNVKAADNTIIQIGNTWSAADNDSTGLQQAGPESWFTHMCLLSGGRILNVFNAGIASDTLDNMVARFQADVVAHQPDIVFLGDATNDINNAVPDATIRGYVADLVRQARVAGIAPILVGTSHRSDAAKTLRAIEHNAWMRKYAAENRLPFIDPFASIVDINSSSAALAAAYTTDGLHLNAAGAKVVGQRAVDDLAGFLRGNATPTRATYLPQHAANPTAPTVHNIFYNPLFLLDGNGDSKADYWAHGTATYTLATDSAVLGKAQTHTAGAGQTISLNRDSTVDDTLISVGDRLAWSGMFKADASAGSLNYIVYIKNLGGSTIKEVRPLSQVVGLDYGWTPFYCEYVVPAGATAVRAGVMSVAGTGSLSIAQQQLRNLTKLGLD